MAEVKQGAVAVVTGGASGIGLELARLCAGEGHTVIIVDKSDEGEALATRLAEESGASVTAIKADLSDQDGVDAALDQIDQPIDLLFANAGIGIGKAFLDEAFDDVLEVIDTNVNGTLYLIHRVGRQMRQRGEGRILVTGSIAGEIPGPYMAVYHATKAFMNTFTLGLRHEMRPYGVVVSVLMPGRTDTAFFDDNDLEDTRNAQAQKDDPADVAKTGYHALMRDEASVVHGLHNKLQVAASKLAPRTATAAQHAKSTKPGSATDH
jgi:short-subunit dehydrogenase